jgi:hypothetical protein
MQRGQHGDAGQIPNMCPVATSKHRHTIHAYTLLQQAMRTDGYQFCVERVRTVEVCLGVLRVQLVLGGHRSRMNKVHQLKASTSAKEKETESERARLLFLHRLLP